MPPPTKEELDAAGKNRSSKVSMQRIDMQKEAETMTSDLASKQTCIKCFGVDTFNEKDPTHSWGYR